MAGILFNFFYINKSASFLTRNKIMQLKQISANIRSKILCILTFVKTKQYYVSSHCYAVYKCPELILHYATMFYLPGPVICRTFQEKQLYNEWINVSGHANIMNLKLAG